MATLSKTHIVKKVEVYSEFSVSKRVSHLLNEAGYSVNTREIERQHDEYFNMIHSEILTRDKDRKIFDEEFSKREPLVEGSSQSIVDSIIGKYGEEVEIEIVNTAREENLNGVEDKADISIVIDNDVENPISLKQYMKLGDVQVASGTYLSTLCGLSFDVVGRGSFMGPRGKFTSKDCHRGKPCTCQLDKIKSQFSEKYGEEIVPFVDELWNIKDDINKLRTYKIKPSDKFLDNYRYKVGVKAIKPFLSAIDIIQKVDGEGFKSRLLSRLALSNNDESVVISGFSKKKSFTFNSEIDKPLFDLVGKLTDENTKLVFNPHGKGIRGSFTNNGEEILEVTIPFTININGSWVGDLNGRICSKDKKFYNYREMRPKKAQEMDTSTNCWLKMKPIFNECLSLRPQNGYTKL